MKRLSIFALILIVTPFFLTCDSTSSEEETSYDLIVINSLDISMDIFIQEQGFDSNANRGTVNGSSQLTIPDFEVGNTYVLTATDEGGTPDNWYYQTEFSNNNTDNLEITISVQF